MTDFTLTSHHDFVQRHGDCVRWYRGLLCPCGNTPDANRSRLTCIHCGGLGIRYEAPVELVGIVTGVTREKALLESGIAEPGDMLLGLSPFEHNILSDWDMIELQWAKGQPYQGDVIRRATESSFDLLMYPAKEIFSCTSIDPNSQAITTYLEGASFTVSGRTLTWVDGQSQPDPGQTYSIKYAVVFQWICFVSPFDRREGDVNLGQKCLLRRRHAVLKK